MKIMLALIALTVAAVAHAQSDRPTPDVVLRVNAPPISPDNAKAMAPDALGDLLLAPGHATVTGVTVGLMGMVPPPPPGRPVSTPIALYLEPAEDAAHPGFCRRTIATVDLAPVDRDANQQVPPSLPANLSLRSDYRLNDSRSAASCADPKKRAFFSVRSEDGAQPFEAIVALVALKHRVMRNGPIRFPITVSDVEGPQMIEYERAHPDPRFKSDFEVITDPSKALRAISLDQITYAGPSSIASPNILTATDLASVKDSGSNSVTMFVGGDWVVGMVIKQGKISLLRMRREIPAPF